MSIFFILFNIIHDMNRIKLIDIFCDSFYTAEGLSPNRFIPYFIEKETETMLQSIQNYDRLLEMLRYGRLITKWNNLIPRGYSPFVDSPGNVTINRNIENLPLRVSTDDGQLVLEAAMPGVNPKDIDIFVENIPLLYLCSFFDQLLIFQ